MNAREFIVRERPVECERCGSEMNYASIYEAAGYIVCQPCANHVATQEHNAKITGGK